MFLLDKYKPKSINDAIENGFFHKESLLRLKKMCEDESIPHTIFYGDEGVGKKTIINLFMDELFGKEVYNTIEIPYTILGSGNNSKVINITQSIYHISINPTNTNFDKYIIQDVVNKYAKRIQLNIFSKKKIFRLVLINNVDDLPYYAQTSLRRTLEKYSGICRFVLCCRSISKVIEPLISRCYPFHIKRPTNIDLTRYIFHVSYHEKVTINLDTFSEILRRSNGNIKKLSLLLDLYFLGSDFDTSYDIAINNILELITYIAKSKNYDLINIIKAILYSESITGFNCGSIVKDISMKILDMQNIEYKTKSSVIRVASIIDHALNDSRRKIIATENFIIHTIDAFKSDSMFIMS